MLNFWRGVYNGTLVTGTRKVEDIFRFLIQLLNGLESKGLCMLLSNYVTTFLVLALTHS